MGDTDIRFDYWMNYDYADSSKAVGDGPYWLATYGGSAYKTNGSNGEILLPYKAAKTLFNNTPTGTVIIIQ
jgi:hypothetical protein